MSLKEVLERYEKLRSSLKLKEVREFWTQQAESLTPEEKREVALLLIEEDEWSYADLISFLLEDAFEDGADPLEFLKTMQSEIKEARGTLLTAAHSIARSWGDQGPRVLRKALSEENLSPYTLAGFFISRLEREPELGILALFELIQGAESSNEAVVYVETIINASFPRNAYTENLLDGLRQAELLLSAELHFRLVWAYISLYHLNPERCHDELIRLARSEGNVRYYLASRAGFDSRLGLNTRKALLKLLAENEETGILDVVIAGIAEVGKSDPVWGVDILLNLSESDYFRINSLDYAFGELGKIDFESCMSRLETWIRSKPGRERFFGPDIAIALGSKRPDDLVPWVERWLNSGNGFQTAALNSVRKLLSRGWELDSTNALAEKIWPLLESIGEEEAIAETKDLPNKWDTATFRCLVLAKELLYPSPTPNPNDVEVGWKKCGALRQLMKEDWIEDEIKSQRPRHPMSYFLASIAQEKDDRWKPRAERLVSYLDDLAGNINAREKGSKVLRDGLRNRKQFWQAVSEMEVVTKLRKHGFEVEMQPSIDSPESSRGRKLDAKVIVLGEEVYIEVVTPETYLPLEVVQAAVGLPNRAVRIILDKVKDQFDGADLIRGKPVVLVINVSRSEIDAYDATDALAGQIKLRLWFDRKEGKAISQNIIREMNAVSDKTDAGRLLSGAFLVRRSGADVRTVGLWVPNKNPYVDMDDKVRKLIEKALIDETVED